MRRALFRKTSTTLSLKIPTSDHRPASGLRRDAKAAAAAAAAANDSSYSSSQSHGL